MPAEMIMNEVPCGQRRGVGQPSAETTLHLRPKPGLTPIGDQILEPCPAAVAAVAVVPKHADDGLDRAGDVRSGSPAQGSRQAGKGVVGAGMGLALATADKYGIATFP